MEPLPIRYDFREAEKRIYALWLDSHAFDSHFDSDGNARPGPAPSQARFVVVIPPPNVTGRLHMGHALNNTVQDALIRYKRMDGFDALWVPGTDHAGISTQTVVRKQLDAQGIDYRELGREKFVEKVWEWKATYGDMILEQLRKLGCSCDWRRIRFTMDEGLSRAVRTSFKRLYDSGLIYRGKRIVNWCPVDRTALSDDEVDVAEDGEPGHLWYVRYPLVDPVGGVTHLVVATTRPETLFGDVAVAVHPDDERYRALVGQKLRLPLQGRIIPVIADAYVDPAFGTGSLKITPAHDPNDFEVGRRHGLEPVNVMNEDATLNDVVPLEFRGLKRFVARERAVRALEAQGLLERVEDKRIPLGRAQRSREPIEYRLSDQWFVKMAPLAEKALRASGYRKTNEGWQKNEPGELRFYPERWENVYVRWLTGIRDWCISRQIWWGHRIPAWHHRTTAEIVVDIDTPDVVRKAPEEWIQDTDVLDTWFSSWLWPMSTLGWPEPTKDFERYYPTTTLVTDKGIIFFWVARMNFAGLELSGRLPYRDVFINPTVLDDRGAIMSKSKGNGIDPLAVIEGATCEELKAPIFEARPPNMKEMIARVEKAFPNGFEGVGADAFRYTLISSCSEGQELRLSYGKFTELGRRFITKLWNVSRFVLMNLDEAPGASAGMAPLTDEDRWIESRAASTIADARAALDGYNFAPLGQILYRFVWNDYCDWFVELSKGRLQGDDPAAKRRAAAVNGQTLATILRLLHPIAPFVTEEIWSKLVPAMDKAGLSSEARPTSPLLIRERYPRPETAPDPVLEERFEAIQRLVRAVRNLRVPARIGEGIPLTAIVKPLTPDVGRLIEASTPVLSRLANLDAIQMTESAPAGLAASIDSAFELYVDLSKYMDIGAERARIEKEVGALQKKLDAATTKLANPKFVAGAKPEVVEGEKAKESELQDKIAKLRAILRD